MFDFEKLEVYQEIRVLNKTLLPLVFKFQKSDPYLADQLKRAGLSVQLNLAEGTGRMTNADKKRFYIMSRSSVNECVSILQTAVDIEIINEVDYTFCYEKYEKISKMLLGMIRSLS
ncbi:MAG: four helix bundle protein [Chitinophagales bacterium]|nr:four helix bundle protein [Bdellovibrionales bacterium]MCB9226160.1 four helix bundle protein [Chitinophagales bacterium]